VLGGPAGSFGRVYLGIWRQTKVAIKLLAHPADVFLDGSGEPHGLVDDHDRRAPAARGTPHPEQERRARRARRTPTPDPGPGRPAAVRGRPSPCGAAKRAPPRTSQRIAVPAWAPPAVAHRAAVFTALSSAQVRAAGREASEARAAALLSAVKAEAAMIASLRHPNIVMFMGAPPTESMLAPERSSQRSHAAAPIGTALFGSQPPCRPAWTDAAALRGAGVCCNPPLIIMEFCQRGSLYDVLKQASEDPVRPRAQPSLPRFTQRRSTSVTWGKAAWWAGDGLAHGDERWGPSVWRDARGIAHAVASAWRAVAAPGRKRRRASEPADACGALGRRRRRR